MRDASVRGQEDAVELLLLALERQLHLGLCGPVPLLAQQLPQVRARHLVGGLPQPPARGRVHIAVEAGGVDVATRDGRASSISAGSAAHCGSNCPVEGVTWMVLIRGLLTTPTGAPSPCSRHSRPGHRATGPCGAEAWCLTDGTFAGQRLPGRVAKSAAWVRLPRPSLASNDDT